MYVVETLVAYRALLSCDFRRIVGTVISNDKYRNQILRIIVCTNTVNKISYNGFFVSRGY